MVCGWHWSEMFAFQSAVRNQEVLLTSVHKNGSDIVQSAPLSSDLTSLWGYSSSSMGRNLIGMSCCVLKRNSDSTTSNGGIECSDSESIEVEADENEVGELAIYIPDSPLMFFHGYWNNPIASAKCFGKSGKYYRTGDLAYFTVHNRDDETSGSIRPSKIFHYSSRDDDVIKSSGYRLGPFEIESCILMDERISEVAVVGIPDNADDGEMRGQVLIFKNVLHCLF